MALYKIRDFDPDYRDHFDGDDVKDLDLYNGSDKIGSVKDVLVDEEGRFRYLVISTGAWIFGKNVLLPIGRAQIDYGAKKVFANGLTKEQVEQLPEFSDDMKMDYHSEEQVRGVYRGTPTMNTTATAANAPLESSPALNSDASMGTAYAAAAPTYDENTYDYGIDQDLYKMDHHDDRIRLYEERLVANKRRMKAGEVTVGKHVETETARVNVPIEKERVVVERTTPTSTTAVPVGEAAFNEGEVARMEVYEETPDVHKEAFVREEVKVTKVVDQETVSAEEKIRREELDIDTQGRLSVDDPNRKV
ncbi:MAG TPA: DUF2382 domain-containing protein [Leptolyngbya sp.]|jgi:uncharacterized protein (TIGR02271 family)|nr:DUF2382 domain-containing protein [Leptolyngbya sp.]